MKLLDHVQPYHFRQVLPSREYRASRGRYVAGYVVCVGLSGG